MATLDDYLAQEGSKKYAEFVKLTEEDSKNDPEDDPYRSKYSARKRLEEIKASIDKFLSEQDTDENLTFVSAALHLQLGSNYIDTEELSTGEENLSKCISLQENRRLNKKCTTILQQCYNQLGILWCGRRNYENALKFLELAEQLYHDFNHEIGGSPCTIQELFLVDAQMDEESKIHGRSVGFESGYTHTLYYLAQVYAKLEENKKSAEYCHATLHRQLQSKKYDPVDWALNAATLSQYYMTNNNFTLARHCLASASRIYEEVSDLTTPPEDESEVAKERHRQLLEHCADIERCWVKYGLALLETSRDRLLEKIENTEDLRDFNPIDNSGLEKKYAEVEEKHPLQFDLELTSFESLITDKCVVEFSQARDVFLQVQKWLNCAREVYNIDWHCSDYVEILQDHSRLFKTLAFFEMDLERQSKMHKRRVDMLSDLLKELNPQFYLLVCRQLMYEIAETYSTMLDCKLAIIEENGQPATLHAAKKVNQLVKKSIDQYQAYLDSLLDAQKKFPEKLSDENVRPALVAKFCMGRLFSKFIESEKRKKLENVKESLDHYSFLVDYCCRNPESCEIVQSELEICREMVSLLPAKLDRIAQSM